MSGETGKASAGAAQRTSGNSRAAAPRNNPVLRRASQVHRREELLAVAARLFAGKGFAGTSMDAVAREMGIQKASLYYWVDSKETLLYEVVRGALAELTTEAEAIAANAALPFARKLRDLIALNCQFTINHPDVMGVFFRELKWLSGPRGREVRDIRLGYNRMHEDVFASAIDAGEITIPRLHVPVYVNIMFSITSNLPVWYRPGGAMSRFQIADLIAEMVLSPALAGRFHANEQ